MQFFFIRSADDDSEATSDKPKVKSLCFYQSELSKWAPIQKEAKSVLLESINSSSRYAINTKLL